eukprot:847145-Pelagomonas_calceolata.AAC.2
MAKQAYTLAGVGGAIGSAGSVALLTKRRPRGLTKDTDLNKAIDQSPKCSPVLLRGRISFSIWASPSGSEEGPPGEQACHGKSATRTS